MSNVAHHPRHGILPSRSCWLDQCVVNLIVPAGMTKEGLPVTISFFGEAYSESKLLAYGYDFELATKARVLPKHTPALPSDTITY